MATATKTRTLEVTCPKCRDEDATITLNLNDLAECTCSACDETFSAREAAEAFAAMAAKWVRVAAWIDAAPTA